MESIQPDAHRKARASLLAALDALPRGALVGLATFGRGRLGLWDLRGGAPLERCLPLLDGLPPLVALGDVLPLDALLAPAGAARARLAQALELLSAEAHAPATPEPQQQQQQYQQYQQQQQVVEGMDRSGGDGRGGGSGSGKPRAPRRALGAALEAVFDYVIAARRAAEGDDAAAASGAQAPALGAPFLGQLGVAVVTSGPCDYGPGKTAFPGAPLVAAASGGSAVMEPRGLAESRAFYERAAAAAATAGACVDVFAVASGEAVGLRLLEPLCAATGGCLFLYPSAEAAPLPQDLPRRLTAPRAFGGLLRVRASAPLRAGRCYGRAFADPSSGGGAGGGAGGGGGGGGGADGGGLFHVPSADAGAALAVDLDYRPGADASAGGSGSGGKRGGGGAGGGRREAVVQIAFQYSQVVPVAAGPAGGGGGGAGGGGAVGASSSSLQELAAAAAAGGGAAGGGGAQRFELQRRLRVATFS